MKICIVTTGRSFSPDALAYREFFLSRGHSCSILWSGESLEGFDVAILFNGINPFWRKYPPVVVAEYQSLSTGRGRRLKDLLKRAVNKRGDLYVFLNEYVRRGSFHPSTARHILRPMGFSSPRDPVPLGEREFDIVYAGSNRPGLVAVFRHLAELGLKLLAVGNFPTLSIPNVDVISSVSAPDVPQYLDRAKVGLNFVPLRQPYIFQDSTKVIEYASRGLGILSNPYPWIDEFMAQSGGTYLSLRNAEDADTIRTFDYRVPEVSNREWTTLLSRSALIDELELLFHRTEKTKA